MPDNDARVYADPPAHGARRTHEARLPDVAPREQGVAVWEAVHVAEHRGLPPIRALKGPHIGSGPRVHVQRKLAAARTAGGLVVEEQHAAGDWSLPADSALVSDGALRYITLSREFFPGELQPLLERHVAMLTAWFGEPIVRAGGVRIWDIQNDTGLRSWTFTTWTPPAGYVTQSGMAALPDSVRSPGWRNWSRSFPPVAPSDRPVKADDDRYAQLPAMIRRQLERKNPAPDTGTMPEEDAP